MGAFDTPTGTSLARHILYRKRAATRRLPMGCRKTANKKGDHKGRLFHNHVIGLFFQNQCDKAWVTTTTHQQQDRLASGV